ncbi:hypothetical protein LU604_03505 [Erwinia tracheiphila]|uniref:hypothetical protein n=1 Tax=Erwinia tracheiphila TaxID=65700 RepID=UPI001F1ED32F|nr:hypothetical protein [Erwinia tracheiphila]UIA84145.1 hypothetical protein LU604_03505 [Erwinia tracheiphila]UIA92727.1 hypothetical protein LU632_03465 [Erwinia tracheiphila]
MQTPEAAQQRRSRRRRATFLRKELCYTATLCPDDSDNWSQTGLEALALPSR